MQIITIEKSFVKVPVTTYQVQEIGKKCIKDISPLLVIPLTTFTELSDYSVNVQVKQTSMLGDEVLGEEFAGFLYRNVPTNFVVAMENRLKALREVKGS